MHHRYNARSSVAIFRYKPRFLEVFADYIGREYLCVDRAPASEFAFWVDRWPRFIAKPADGVLGRGVTEIVAADWQSRDDLRMYLKRHRLGLLEEPIRQHDALSALCPSSVNTVRITTLCLDGSVEILSAVLRIGSGAFVDNLGAGGIAAPVDETCGTVIGPAVAKDVREDRHVRHPLTGAAILGFSIPFWPQVLRLVTDAARIVPDVHTVGWDVAVGANGPLLVEGNDNWDKTLAQLPSGKGLMPILCKLEQRVNSSSANR
ncbi:MAG: hypothetical protein GX601_15685 [Anaerolineales bacterium]|nr:hypothetical protein [Anaerolineales bacterium]